MKKSRKRHAAKTSETNKRKKLDIENDRYFIDKDDSIIDITERILEMQDIALISPSMTGKSTILSKIAKSNSFEKTIVINFQNVCGSTPEEVVRSFTHYVSYAIRKPMPDKIDSLTASNLIRSFPITEKTLFAVDEYEIPFLAYYAAERKMKTKTSLLHLLAIKSFYEGLLEYQENKYVVLTGFTDLAISELPIIPAHVFTFHNDPDIRPYFGVEKKEIEALPVSANVCREILNLCDEQYTFFRDENERYYLFHGVAISLIKNGLIPGSVQSQNVIPRNNSIWKFLFHCSAVHSVIQKIFLAEEEEDEKFRVTATANSRITHLYNKEKSEKALENLLIQSGILLISNGVVELSHIIPNDDLEKLIRKTVESQMSTHNYLVHNYINAEKYDDLTNYLSDEFYFNLPCSENYLIGGDRAWIVEMVYKFGLNILTSTTEIFDRVMQIENIYGKADIILKNPLKIICIKVKVLPLSEALSTLKSKDFREAFQNAMKKSSDDGATQIGLRKYFSSVNTQHERNCAFTSIVMVICKDIICTRVQKCVSSGGTERRVSIKYAGEQKYYFPDNEDSYVHLKKVLDKKSRLMERA